MDRFAQSFRRKLQETFSPDSFGWFDRSYIVDWAFPALAWILTRVIKTLSPFEREFSIDDPLISHEQRHDRVPSIVNWLIAFITPLGIVFLIGLFKLSALEIHHGILGLWATKAYNSFIIDALKNRVGRLRPDFLARCKWDAEIHACTGKISTVMEGRRSFPSGHSSTAFSGMTFLALYLAGLTGAWRFNQASRPGSIFGSRMARLWLTLTPLAYATWVAITRMEDNRHHKEDVVVGGLIGIGTATVCYLIYFPSPFTVRSGSEPRQVYRDGDLDRTRREYDYELAETEHIAEHV